MLGGIFESPRGTNRLFADVSRRSPMFTKSRISPTREPARKSGRGRSWKALCGGGRSGSGIGRGKAWRGGRWNRICGQSRPVVPDKSPRDRRAVPHGRCRLRWPTRSWNSAVR